MATKRNQKPRQAKEEAPAPDSPPEAGLADGIEYVDWEEAPVDPNVAAAAGHDNLAQLEERRGAARAAQEERVPFIPTLLGQRPRPPTEEELKRLKAQKKYFMVMEDKRIRRGAATYVLCAGKVFDNNQYDVASLLRQGVKLKEIEDPSRIQFRPDF